jgi:CheY-like chemotaxis protein
MAIKGALVEDNAGLQASWARLIRRALGFQCVGICGSGEEALNKVPAAMPDMVLRDINLPKMSGLECAAFLKQRLSQVQSVRESGSRMGLGKSAVRPRHAALAGHGFNMIGLFVITTLVLSAEMLSAIEAGGREAVRPNYTPVVAGLDYAHLQTTNPNNGEPWSIHIARLDRSRRDLHLAETLAHHQVFGTAPVSAIAKSFPKEQGDPLVAINAGFCIRKKDPYMGAPRGIGEAAAAMVVTDGEVISAPSKYSFWVNEDRSMHFGQFESRFSATLPDGTTVPIGMNNKCEPGGVMLFTHMLGQSTRATNHLELVLEDPKQEHLSWRVGESYILRVKAVNPSGNTFLSNNIAVLSFGSQTAPKASQLRPGDNVKLELKTLPALNHVVTACHAIFPIVQNGKPLEKFDANAVIQHRNPRTAIGFNDRYFFMVVVDGRQKTLSMGMTARELAEFMSLLGCTEAKNQDGGGSSTFWMGGKTRNSVSGGTERPRSDALVIVKRGEVSQISASPNR